ncbi:hypothetical protein P4V54_08035 [Brevibacillus nitrificans]|uniref:hypothetical protein n=1 Tax=Brevibacillus nitrificans TaxID=651560 RepID=UPI002E2253A2|nr:hypothetical protein [Brevibacillus nitrificans]
MIKKAVGKQDEALGEFRMVEMKEIAKHHIGYDYARVFRRDCAVLSRPLSFTVLYHMNVKLCEIALFLQQRAERILCIDGQTAIHLCVSSEPNLPLSRTNFVTLTYL